MTLDALPALPDRRRWRGLALGALAVLLGAPAAARAAGSGVKGTVVFPPVRDDPDPRPSARPPLGSWRLENGKLRIAAEPDVYRDVVVALEPLQAVRLETVPVTVESRPGGALEPRVSVAVVGVEVTWKNADSVDRTVTLEDGDTLMPPEATAAGGTRTVRFTIAGEYVFIDPEHPFARALVVVAETPYLCRLDDHSGFSIDAPDGRYRLKAWWHGRWIDLQPVELSGGRVRELVVKLPPSAPPAPTPAPPATEKN